jgi:predicted permease
MISSLFADMRFGARAISQRPGFAAVVVLTLACGIGVNVALFSLFQQILLRPLPVAEADRLVNLSDPGPKLDPRAAAGGARPSTSGGIDTVFSYPMFRDLERAQEPFVGIAAYRIEDMSLATGQQARRDLGLFVSGSYFPLLGIQPALGRLLSLEDDRVDGQAESVVLSHAYWQNEFAGDPTVVGRSVIVNGTSLTIVGVAPPGFHGTTVGARAIVFVPITFRGVATRASLPNHDNRGYHWAHLFARLEPGVTLEEAAAAINPLYRALVDEREGPIHEQGPEALRTKSLVLEAGAHGQSTLVAPVRERLRILFAVSGAVLLLCCANVAGLVLLRGSGRTGELAVRSSMGATRVRLASLLLVESLLLTLPAALLSLPVALLTLQGIARTFPDIRTSAFATVELGAAFDVSVSSAAALVAVTVSVVSALAFGLFPIRGLLRTEPAKTLLAYGARQTSGKGVTRFRAALATAQIALSMSLLAMAGVFAQSLANIARVDLGLDVDSVVAFSISPQTSGYAPDASTRLFERLEAELAAIPGVSSVGSSDFRLLSGGEYSQLIRGIDGVDMEVLVPSNNVSPGFFRTLGVELLAGREFRDTDGTGPPWGGVIVNQRFAERFGRNGEIVGTHIRFTTRRNETVEIVGIVADAKHGNVTGEIGPQLFLPQRYGSTIYVRGAQSPESLISAVREAAARVDPVVPVQDLRTMQQQVRENLATERFVAGASTAFAVLATVLAGLGLYGVLAYSVAQRSREIGLRFALGAPAARIRAMVLRQVMRMAVIGIVLGVAAAWLLGRAAGSLLFGIDAGNPVVLGGAALVLAAVMIGAAYIPARRASKVDPMTVLRSE